MIGYLFSLSLLILVVLLIRGVFRKTISPRAIYALWLVVVIRMLVPISLFEIDVTLPAFMKAPQNEQIEQLPNHSQFGEDINATHENPSWDSGETIPDYPPVTVPPVDNTTPIPNQTTEITPITPERDTLEVIIPDIPAKKSAPINWKQIADLIWFSGAVIAAVWFALTSITYSKHLYKCRKLHKTVRGKKVYISEGAGVPCIAGIVPSIYINPETANSKSEALILAHEYVHLRHGDHIWSIIRTLALIVFWYNPLVWIAATVSKQDAELACDDTVSSKLSDDGKLEYANILLDTIPQNRRYAVGLGSAPIKERILMLTGKHKNRLICLILAIVLTLSAVGCSFVSLNEKEDHPDNSEDQQTEATLPDNFAEIYAEAERVYSLFTGYRDNIYTNSTLTEHGADYRSVDINGYTTLGELRSYCEQYFGTELTNELMSRTTSYEKHPLFIERNGKLYSFDGFVALYGYDIGSDYKMTLLGCEDGIYSVEVDAVMHEGGFEIPATANCTYTLSEDGEIRFTSFELMAKKLLDAFANIPVGKDPSTLEYTYLMSDGSGKISLYYAPYQYEDFAKDFRVILGNHKANITLKNSEAWLRYTWEPRIYCMDISAPGLPLDGVEDAVIILTTGTGTGIHMKEAYILSGADGTLHAFCEPYTVIENAVARDENGKTWIVDSSGKRYDLADNAYFDKHYEYFIKDGYLYANVSIGYNLLQYVGDYFLVRYTEDGVTWEYVSVEENVSEQQTFEYKGVKYDLSEIYSGVNGVWEWGHIGKYVIAEGHINPNMAIFAVINPETQKIEHHFAGCIATYYGEDINTIVYSYWNSIKAYDGTVLAELELSDGEYIRSLEYTANNTQIIVSIDAEDSPRTVTIDLAQSEDTGYTPEDVILLTSPNGRYSVKFYMDIAASYPVSGTFFHLCNRVSLIDNQTGKEIVTDNKGYMLPSPNITEMWSSDSKYCAVVVGDSRYASSPLFFDTSRGKILGFDLHTTDVAQVIENESQRPVRSVLYSIHERVLEFLGDDKVKLRANIKVGSADVDKYVIAEYVYSLSSQKISDLTYTFSDNYYPAVLPS